MIEPHNPEKVKTQGKNFTVYDSYVMGKIYIITDPHLIYILSNTMFRDDNFADEYLSKIVARRWFLF